MASEPAPSNECPCPNCRLVAILDPEGHPDRIDYLAELVKITWDLSRETAELNIAITPDMQTVLLAALYRLDLKRQVPESTEVRHHRETN